nr:pyrin and HIN domain-containing protein 1-like [Microcebus murinus]XP_012607836.1 pyrin and HIN domain-containing protein 1-like [Microcebus murinus]
MGNQRGKIILLKVLDELDVDQFKMIKFLLSDIIKLSDKMQEEYDKVKIANLMVKRFPRDAGVDKLIQLCKDIPAFQGLVETLKESKVAKKVKSTPEKGTTPSKKSKQKEEGPSTLAPFTGTCGAEVTPGPQKRKSTAKGKDGTKRSKVSKEQPQSPCPVGASVSTAMGPPQTSSAPSNTFPPKNPKPQANSGVTARRPELRKGPTVVMVLSAADPFAYESSEKEIKKMFHATVATEKQFFHMKVFNIKLKRIFTRNRIIILSDYFESDHLLEVNEASSVSEAGPDQKIEVPNNIKKRAKETLPIGIIKRQASGTIVYGLFTLHKKTVDKNNTIYKIKEDEEEMEVVGKGKCHNIHCEEGDKLQLFCFRLRKKNDTSKLISEIHSFIQVKPKANQTKFDLKTMKPFEEQSEAPKHSEARTTLTHSQPWSPQMPPAAPSRTFVCEAKPKANQRKSDSETMKLFKEQSETPKYSETGTTPTQSYPWSPQMPPAAPSSTFVFKKEEAVPGAETSSASFRGSTATAPRGYPYMAYQASEFSRFLNQGNMDKDTKEPFKPKFT